MNCMSSEHFGRLSIEPLTRRAHLRACEIDSDARLCEHREMDNPFCHQEHAVGDVAARPSSKSVILWSCAWHDANAAIRYQIGGQMDTKAEEFRFAKKQQWYVATAAVTLIAAIFAVADKVHVTAFEKGVVVVALVAIAIFASWTLCSTQKYIVSMRGKNDRQPWACSRGADIMWALVVVVLLGGWRWLM